MMSESSQWKHKEFGLCSMWEPGLCSWACSGAMISLCVSAQPHIQQALLCPVLVLCVLSPLTGLACMQF